MHRVTRDNQRQTKIGEVERHIWGKCHDLKESKRINRWKKGSEDEKVKLTREEKNAR